jgi:hypothetical protein
LTLWIDFYWELIGWLTGTLFLICRKRLFKYFQMPSVCQKPVKLD